MMKNIKLILLGIIISNSVISQTKKIVHLSHSGSNESFLAANYNDNIGGPVFEFYNYTLDSIVKVNDSTIVEISINEDGKSVKFDTLKYNGDLFIIDSTILIENQKFINYSSGFFTKKQSVDTVDSFFNRKEDLNRSFCFVNANYVRDIKKAKKIGFEKEYKLKKQKNGLLLLFKNKPKLILTLLLLFFALIIKGYSNFNKSHLKMNQI